jgi:predicted DNA binding CopG/RHH family protein
MKKIPRSKSEEKEREFWTKADSVDYIEWSKGRRVVFPNLKPSLKTISLRLPELMLEELKLLANKRDVPYQSLIKIFLAERIEKELNL